MNNNTKFNGITYLTELIEDTIDLYAHKFKTSERPKIVAILNYYGLTLGSDVEYSLEINKWGNRELKLRWYLSPTFNPLHEDWGPNGNPTIFTTTTISY